MNSISRSLLKQVLILAAVLCITPMMCLKAATAGKTFASPEDAVKAFSNAVNNNDTNALIVIFGSDFDQIQSPNPARRQEDMATIAKRLKEGTQLEPYASNRVVVDIGKDRWPFAVPIVQTNGSWQFDTDAGKDELQSRRVGGNERDALRSVRAYAVAQRVYASKDRNGDQVPEYAQKFISSPGQQDGLYWSADAGGETSPLGPLYAQAQSAAQATANGNGSTGAQPFYGYYFKILDRQGKNAQGGAKDYVNNGHMTDGFALVAWPADYGKSGVMTFIINQQGKVYQKDLGKNTADIAQKMQAYDPDRSWNAD